MPKKQKSAKTPESKQVSWSMIITAIFLIIFSLFLPAAPNKSQPYSEFINLVESDAYGELLKELAQSLLDKEVLEGEKLRSHLAQAQKTLDADRWLQTGESNFSHNAVLPRPNIAKNGKSLQC